MFDDALLESRKTRAPGAKRLSLPAAAALHAAVIAALVGASAWSTEDPPEPTEKISCTLGERLSPPPPKGNGAETPRTTHARSARTLSEPVRVPENTSVPAAAESEPDQPVGLEPGEVVGPGLPTGVEGGTGKPDATRTGEPGGEEILIPGGDVRAPVVLDRVEPDYPEAARRARLEGTVILEATITAAGEVQQVRVLKAVNPLLDESAVRAVRAWRYRPATLNGRAVPVYLTVTVRFGIAG